MKTIFVKSAVIFLAIGLAALYSLGLSVPIGDLSPFSTYSDYLIYDYLFYIVCCLIIGFSAAWFFYKRHDDNSVYPYRWYRLIPIGVVITSMHLYYHFNRTVPTDTDGWIDVIFQVARLICWITAGILITSMVLTLRNSSFRKWKVIPQAIVTIILIFLAYDQNIFFGGYEWWHVEKLYTFALPLVFWCISEGLCHSKLPCCRYSGLIRPVYFLMVSGLTAVSVCWYNYNNIVDYDIVRLFCLIMSAVMALWIAEGETFGNWFLGTPVRKFYERPILWTVAMAFGFFCTSERFTNILSTWDELAEPYISMPGVYDMLEFRNWFAYRWTVLLENLRGCLDSVYKLNVNQVPRWNSLVWLNHIYGLLPVAAAMLMLAGVFVLLWKCAKNNDRLSRYLYAVLILRTVLGLVANLLVVYSTEITPLMMGMMPWDVIFVIMILWTRKGSHSES